MKQTFLKGAIMNTTESQKSNKLIEEIFKKIEEDNPYGFILRTDLGIKTGGLLNSRHAANLDSEKRGIKGRFKVGKKLPIPFHL
jgi:hypothetical protein